MKAVIYHVFSHKEAKEHDVQELGSQRTEAFVRAFLKQSIPHWSQQDCESHLQRKALVLEYLSEAKAAEEEIQKPHCQTEERHEAL
ncbi:ribonuclease P protein subunit p29-like isoform X2 [Peromyscus californicus insignis]|uniref:ribonuclease P protein subunit p29-like isoform X2 n=1 Tax=Peromyscus californicus insignis TaxID=564181 RepID=UPI0022A789DB|nr:ribonuclease P protein subunit p29-like isoform X2 [Peromyscus californicus insignis]